EGDEGNYLVDRKAGAERSRLELAYDPFWASAVVLLSLYCGWLFRSAARAFQTAEGRPEVRLPLAYLFWPDAPHSAGLARRGDPRVSLPQMATWKQMLALTCCCGALIALYGLWTYLCLIHLVLNWQVLWDRWGWRFFLPPVTAVALLFLAVGGRTA